MNYSILSTWTNEFRAPNLKVESAWQSSRQIRLVFSDKSQLTLLVGSKAFAFYGKELSPAENEHKIWDLLSKALLTKTQIDPNDRIIRFHFEQTDIFQEKNSLMLIAEFTPPKPNLILAREGEETVVIDALHKYSLADNPHRQILPKLPYQAPKTSFKPVIEELSLPLELKSLQTGETLSFANVNDYLQAYHEHVFLAREDAQLRKNMRSGWERELKKALAKLKRQEQEAADAERVEHWRVCAETLKSNLGQISRGQESLKTINYFDPDLAEIEIPLQTELSARQNLEWYLKKYGKAKRGRDLIAKNIAETKKQIEKLEGILERIDGGEEIALPSRGTKSRPERVPDMLDKLLRLRVSDDFEIVVGRKARENDFITTQLGRPHDWWFHTRIYRGSHILLRCFRKSSPNEELIRVCCALAAWYSKARFSQNVPVDYTQIRFVRKPRKSAPGYVIYTDHKTVFTDPMDLRSARSSLGL
ncbi:MAG: DUF814 domain-containing protein [Candidatus Cloacimonetes bacterium]|nr:DUF814 domain-containing protein [Candidatus Cloacimonadota bacterium]